MPESRRRGKIALNEVSFREVNERLVEDLAQLSATPPQLDIVCECGHLDCRDTVAVTLGEYERVRADPALFLVCDGHEIPDVEDVVDRGGGHVVVRKHEDTHAIVRERNPRGPDGA